MKQNYEETKQKVDDFERDDAEAQLKIELLVQRIHEINDKKE